MRNSFLAIVFCLLSSGAAYAAIQDRGLEVRPAETEFVETGPRSIVTVPFRVTNPAGEKREFISEVTLPEGWKLITEDFPFFDLGPQENITKLVSFLVPEMTPAGDYKITYLVRARKDPAVRDFYTVDVTVLPPAEEEKVPQIRQYVTAGRDHDVYFMVTNKTETENTVSITVDSSENIPFTVDTPNFRLGPGRSKVVTVTIKPDARISKKLKYRLQVTAQIGDVAAPQTQATTVYSMEIAPLETPAATALNKITPTMPPAQKITVKKKPILKT
jgi:hypothetical protein